MTDLDDEARRSVVIHEALMQFLLDTFSHDNPLTILTACTYEIGRIITIMGADLTADDRENLLQQVIGVMRKQIASGLRQ